ncbi:unnamed protein product [Orchesella dallaii]|uniref:Uncharacterized protein n=1 Tax=Orchesella dallaii TaxID=48710 RepID=A0ABP1PUJ0_9HEXA
MNQAVSTASNCIFNVTPYNNHEDKHFGDDAIPQLDEVTAGRALEDTIIGSAMGLNYESDKDEGNGANFRTNERRILDSGNEFVVDSNNGMDMDIINDRCAVSRQTVRAKKGLNVDYELLLILAVVFLPLGIADYLQDKKFARRLRRVRLLIPPPPTTCRANEPQTPPPEYEPPPPYSECRIDVAKVSIDKLIAESKSNYSMSRDNVGVWMNPPAHDDVLTNEDNLIEIIKCVGSTYGTILWSQPLRMPKMGSGSDITNNSLLLFPVIAARHNKFVSALNNTTLDNNALNRKTTTTGLKTNKPINVIVSFDVLATPIHDAPKLHKYMELHNLTDDNMTMEALNTRSLDGAIVLADFANKLYNGTVDTLLLLDEDYLHGETYYKAKDKEVYLEETLYSVKWAISTLTNQLGAREYKLGVLLPYQFFYDDGDQNLETSGIKIEILMNVDVIMVATIDDDGVNNHLVEHSNIVKIIEASDSVLRKLKLNVTIIPVVFCNNRSPFYQNGFVDYERFECWQHMNNWAVKNNRKIIMYEALDNRFDRFQDLGWWTIKSFPTSSEDGPRKLTQHNFLVKADSFKREDWKLEYMLNED